MRPIVRKRRHPGAHSREGLAGEPWVEAAGHEAGRLLPPETLAVASATQLPSLTPQRKVNLEDVFDA